MTAIGHDAQGREIKLPVATKDLVVKDAIGVDRQIVAGMAVPLDLLDAYEAETGDTSAEITDPSTGALTGDYENHNAADLQAEADRRDLSVEGTGKDGNVLKADLVKALEGADAEAGGS